MPFITLLLLTTILPTKTFQNFLFTKHKMTTHKPVPLPPQPLPLVMPKPAMQNIPNHFQYQTKNRPIPLPTPAPIIRVADPNKIPLNTLNVPTAASNVNGLYADSSNNYNMGGGYGGGGYGGGNYGGGGGNYGGGGGHGGGGGGYGGGGGNYGGGGGGYGGGGGGYGGGGGGYGGGGGGGYGGGGDSYGGISLYGGYNSGYEGGGYTDALSAYTPRLSTTIMALGFLAFGAQLASLIMNAVNGGQTIAPVEGTLGERSKRAVSIGDLTVDEVVNNVSAALPDRDSKRVGCALKTTCESALPILKDHKIRVIAGFSPIRRILLNIATGICSIEFPECSRSNG